VIFDCDRVLVDSEPSINQAHADVLTACGYPITAEDLVERFCGMTDAEMLDVIEREWGRMLPPRHRARMGPDVTTLLYRARRGYDRARLL